MAIPRIIIILINRRFSLSDISSTNPTQLVYHPFYILDVGKKQSAYREHGFFQVTRDRPNKDGPFTTFIKSQFTKPVDLPKDINLSGKVAIVTGASTGLGFHSCRHLLSFHLSHLTIAVRSVKKGEDAASKLLVQFPSAKIEVWTLERSSYESIQAFVRRVGKYLTRLDIIILNAGIVKQNYSVVKSTGHEETIQINDLFTVLLSILILPTLKTKCPPSAPGRLTIVGSGTALAAKFPNRHQVPLLKSFDDEVKWDANERYPSSKVLGHYFMVKFANHDVIVNLVDPGLCKGSGLFLDVFGITSAIWTVVKAALPRTLEVGSTAYVDDVAVKGKESYGCYVMDWKICPFATLLYAPDSNTVTERLWDETMKELEFAGPLRILGGLKE